jgi:hypothetical protein
VKIKVGQNSILTQMSMANRKLDADEVINIYFDLHQMHGQFHLNYLHSYLENT